MGNRIVRRLVVAAVLVPILVWMRWSRRSDDSKQVREEMMQVLTQADKYEANREVFTQMGQQAHDHAFSRAYSVGGRYSKSTFDYEKYVDAFFSSLVSQADMLGRQDLKKSILDLQERFGDEESAQESAEESAEKPPPQP